MKTLLILIVVCGFISYLRLKDISHKSGKKFSPFNGTIWDAIGFGLVTVLSAFVIGFLIIKYLP